MTRGREEGEVRNDVLGDVLERLRETAEGWLSNGLQLYEHLTAKSSEPRRLAVGVPRPCWDPPQNPGTSPPFLPRKCPPPQPASND